MHADATDPEREETLSEAFHGVSHLLRQTSLAGLASWDITPSQSRALVTIARGETARGELARGETARGETARGETARGETARGELARGGGELRLSELSAFLRIAPRSTTEVVDDLETKGLVERRPDPTDRRATLVSLTPHGRQVISEIRAARGVEAERVFDRLSATDRKDLARILRKLRR